jgi:V8-like Glu-specific endopeptidase
MDPQAVTASSWPWVALVESFFPTLGGLFTVATASLIHPRVLLTAGHVVYDGTRGGYASSLRAYFQGTSLGPITVTGRDNMPTTQQWVTVDGATLNPTSAYDIAAILLPEAIPWASAVPQAYTTTPGPNLTEYLVNVVGFPVIGDHFGTLYGAQAVPTATTDDAVRIYYPINTIDGMSGGPAYTVADDGRISIRGVHTSFVGGMGSALRITDSIKALIDGWVAFAA